MGVDDRCGKRLRGEVGSELWIAAAADEIRSDDRLVARVQHRERVAITCGSAPQERTIGQGSINQHHSGLQDLG
jgi:hypothetical protein